MTEIDLSLIIPCYNEESILQESVKQVFEVLDNSRFSYEIIFVDDCSQDATRSIIDGIIRAFPGKNLTKIFHRKNTGRGGAVIDGIKAARGKIAGFIDIDLEVHARYIVSCALAVENGADIATAHRVYKFYLKSIVRFIMSRGYIALVKNLLEINLKDTETGFKFFNRKRILPVIDETVEKGWFWDTEIMARSLLKDYRIVEIPCLFLRNFKKPSTVKNISDSVESFRKLLVFRKTFRKLRAHKAVKSYWQNSSSLFSSHYSESKNIFVTDFLVKRLKRIAPLLKAEDTMSVLDAGSGSGVFSRVTAGQGARVTALDYSLEALKICDEKLSAAGIKNYSLVNSDASFLPFSDSTFDLLIAIGLLDYVDNVSKVLEEFKRVVKPKSRIIFTVPKKFSPFFLLRTSFAAPLRNRFLGLPCIKVFLSAEDVKNLIIKSGLTLTKIESFYMTMWIVQCEKK